MGRALCKRLFICIFVCEKREYVMTERLNIAVVGGGAAGFFAAIAAKQNNPEARVTIFERGQKVLAKVGDGWRTLQPYQFVCTDW